MPVSRLVFGSVLLGRAGVRVRSLYIVHMAGGLVVLVAKAGNGGHVVIVFAINLAQVDCLRRRPVYVLDDACAMGNAQREHLYGAESVLTGRLEDEEATHLLRPLDEVHLAFLHKRSHRNANLLAHRIALLDLQVLRETIIERQPFWPWPDRVQVDA